MLFRQSKKLEIMLVEIKTHFSFGHVGQYTSQKTSSFVFLSLQKRKPLDQTAKKLLCLVFKGIIAHLTHRVALKKLIVAAVERLKSPSVHPNYSQTHCTRTIHVPNKVNNAIVIPRIRVACLTNRYCSQIIHTCLQRNIGFRKRTEFCGC